MGEYTTFAHFQPYSVETRFTVAVYPDGGLASAVKEGGACLLYETSLVAACSGSVIRLNRSFFRLSDAGLYEPMQGVFSVPTLI